MKKSSSKGLVLVTGGSGFIAGYCIAELLQDRWQVRTTVRNIAKTADARVSIAKLSDAAETIEFCAADLNSGADWDRAVQGADYVLHVASPVSSVALKNDDVLVKPARDGALRVLNAALAAGVRRVVMTSSASAIFHGHGTHPQAFTEQDWTDETNLADTGAYERSKTVAERAAWRFQETHGGPLELATINPSYVIGPVLGPNYSPSIDVIKKLLDRSLPAIPHFGFDLVDVRDIARLHVLAMTLPAAAGQRFAGSGEFFWMSEIAGILKRGLGDIGRKVPSRNLPDFLVRLIGLVDPVVRGQLFNLGIERRLSSEKARKLLGWTTRPASETILDTARSLIAAGVV